MPLLDFKEISQANNSNGEQDSFELFARDFLEMLGFEIISEPDRGPDGGKDMIVKEKTNITSSGIRWLVSCKHYAHSGKAVGISDENNIIDRLRQHNADGFMGIYSTLASSALNNRLDEFVHNLDIKFYKLFDKEKIESHLLINRNNNNFEIVKRYFPESYSAWVNINRIPSNFLGKYKPLECKYCGEDLLLTPNINKYEGIIIFFEKLESGNLSNRPRQIEMVYWVHKGDCDKKMLNAYRSCGWLYDSWEDISDIIIPGKYMCWIMAILNNIHSGQDVYTDDAYKQLKEFIITVSQLTLRNQTGEELNRLNNLLLYNF
jgi:hypothetical protein